MGQLMMLGAGSHASTAAYSEASVAFDGTANYLRMTDASVAIGGASDDLQGLIFASVTFSNATAAAVEYICAQQTANSFIARPTSEQIDCTWRDNGGTAVISLAGATIYGAEKVNILVALDNTTGATSYLYVWDTTNKWQQEATDATPTNATLDFTYTSFTIGARDSATPALFLPANMHRFALWIGVQPDVTQASVRANFADATSGALVDPATSVAAYGTPVIDIYGAASEYNAGTNHGSGGTFDVVGGTFSDA